MLATNTSSILVTSLAGAAARPENVVGMHFFNPPPLMGLLEVIAPTRRVSARCEVARGPGEAMGKRVIVAADGPGFLVNRCGRPFGGEALRLLQERVATPERIDRICRLGGGFRMGPFELMDLVGIDVGSRWRSRSRRFGEPRWRPNPLQARMVAAGPARPEAGRGWYDYPGRLGPAGGPGAAERGGGEGWAGLSKAPARWRASCAGRPRERATSCARRGAARLLIDTGRTRRAPAARGRSVAFPVRTSAASLGVAATRTRAVSTSCRRSTPAGLVELPVSPHAGAVAEARSGSSRRSACTGVGERRARARARRIVCQLVNEAAFALGEGIGSAGDVDTGLKLGLNHPRGPLAWGEAIGVDHVVATIDGLWGERREERYRAAPLLRRAAAARA